MKLSELMNAKFMVSEEEAKAVDKLSNTPLTITIDVGMAIIVDEVMRLAARSLAVDAVKAVADNDHDHANGLATVGMEVTKFMRILNDALKASDEAVILEVMAQRAAAAAEGNTTPKGTIQ